MIKENWNHMNLLEYVLSDPNFTNLEGVPLLPLNNGMWINFCRCGNKVYICSAEEAEAFLGLENQILRTDLPAPLFQALDGLSFTGI